MPEDPLRPMRQASASDVKVARRPSGFTLLLRFVLLVAAIALLFVAKDVWHAPEWTVFTIAGAEILVIAGVSIVASVLGRRRSSGQAPRS